MDNIFKTGLFTVSKNTLLLELKQLLSLYNSLNYSQHLKRYKEETRLRSILFLNKIQTSPQESFDSLVFLLHLDMALVYLRELDEKTKFAIWKIEESAEELLNKLQLDDRERSKLEQLSKGKRTLHWLATRVLLRQLLQTDDFINCPSDANGKPYLTDFPYKISLTHSYEFAGVMLSTQGECGIDLEIVKDKVLRIKEKFLKPEELQFIRPEDEVEQLYACWCAKEAVYKLQGNKGISFLSDMNIHPFAYRPQGVMTVDMFKEQKKYTFQVYYEKFQNYMLGYVVDQAIY